MNQEKGEILDNSKWMPLSNVDDEEEIWAGARVRLYNVDMNREDKENNFYEYIISYIYDNNNYLQLTNLTRGKCRLCYLLSLKKNYQIIMHWAKH